MPTAKHIVIIAGEESGDAHAAVLVSQLKERYPEIKITGIGGTHMLNAGAELLSNLAQYGVTGFSEVIRHFKIIRQAFKAMQTHLNQVKPDLLILVDYPGFNLRLAKYAKRELNLKILYYISPQIWAWKANRIHLIKECIDRMAVILPFEKAIYEKAGVPVNFVGHPLVDKIPKQICSASKRVELKLPVDNKIIALLPGSRTHEIEKHLPVLRDTAQELTKHDPQLHFVVPIADTLNPKLIASYFANFKESVSLINGRALDCMIASDFVVVASGTASLECALLNKPMCIIYKSSLITYFAAMKVIKVKFLGLCNLLVNKMIVPEFLQYDCNVIELSQYILNYTKDLSQQQRMIEQLTSLSASMSSAQADCSLLELVVRELPEKNA